jgi:hypothetical protein
MSQQVERTVYLISEQQRSALLGYLQDRPFKEVAAGIQFLMNAPTASINVEIPEDTDKLSADAANGESTDVEARELATV